MTGSRTASGRGRAGTAPVPRLEPAAAILAAWRTSSRVTAFLVERLPRPVWEAALPGVPTRSIRMLAGHLHNSRCSWIRTLGAEHGVRVPALVDRRRVDRRRLLAALEKSSAGIEALLRLGLSSGGTLPPTRAYVWRNLPLDVGHVLGYFVAHEGHHRGQIVMAARQLGHRLPPELVNGLWQWNQRMREAAPEGAASARRRSRPA